MKLSKNELKSNYKPAYTLTTKIVNLVAKISAQIERYAIRLEQEDGLRLRKIYRIKTIQGSLAIEGNTLSTDQITAILEGKVVMGTMREIHEAKNAIETYNNFEKFRPFQVKDMLTAHFMLMKGLIDEIGKFRTTGVGVFAGSKDVHIAPPADRVPFLIEDLFDWLKKSDEHLLIKSCVFHYEFEFIHPFADGNGRMGRLWQSLLLTNLHPAFEFLPVENMVFSNQKLYYQAINQSTTNTNCNFFVEFMLNEILETLKKHQGDQLKNNYHTRSQPPRYGVENTLNDTVNDTVNETVKLLYSNPKITIDEIALKLSKSRSTIIRLMKKLQEDNIITRIGSDKKRYWQVNK